MIKEFFTLAWMLFSSKPADFKEVKLMQMEHFPSRKRKYMSWCGRLIYRKDEMPERRREWIKPEYRELTRTQNLLLEEARQYGSWWKYYWNELLNQ